MGETRMPPLILQSSALFRDRGVYANRQPRRQDASTDERLKSASLVNDLRDEAINEL